MRGEYPSYEEAHPPPTEEELAEWEDMAEEEPKPAPEEKPEPPSGPRIRRLKDDGWD